MKKLAELDRDLVLDLLTERLWFEHTGVRLYETAIARVLSSSDALLRRATPLLTRIRAEEHEHATWLEEQLRALGAPADRVTPRTTVARTESSGIARVIEDPSSSLEAVFHAILAAELLDHSGWNLLINLAAEAHDVEAQGQLRYRLNDENAHLHAVRTIVLALARRDLMGIETDVTRKAA
jgi:bacterioferritin (cytochrome b1)